MTPYAKPGKNAWGKRCSGGGLKLADSNTVEWVLNKIAGKTKCTTASEMNSKLNLLLLKLTSPDITLKSFVIYDTPGFLEVTRIEH